MVYILATSFSSGESWLRGFLFGINESIYKFISELYTFLIELAQQGNLIIENTSISDATSKIYSLIGIIMLFRLGIILLRYIADPDKTMDKNGVGSKIISRVITVLALLVLMPTIFTQLYKLQTALFTSSFMTNFFQDNSTTKTSAKSSISESKLTTYSTASRNKDDLVCIYNLDTSTNQTCIELPGNNVSAVSLAGYSYSNSDYDFCPTKIIVNKTQEKIYLYNSKTLKYSLLENKYIDTNNIFSEKDSCTEVSGVFTTQKFFGLRFMLPATFEDLIATVDNAKGDGIYNIPLSNTDYSEVSLQIETVSNTQVKTNPANYILNIGASSGDIVIPEGKKLTDVYQKYHEKSMTIDIDAIISNVAQLNDIKGTLFSDTIMMSFIKPNVFDGISYEKWKAEYDKLSFSETDYMIEENQIKYSVLANLVKEKSNDYFLFEYSGLISLLAGLVVLVMLIATIFKVAIRLFKLIMLEIIAPVPVVLYLDPNDKSAAGGSLSKWASAVAWTYLDVFIRILVILFVAMIIGNVNGYLPTIDSESVDNEMLQLFVIFGALMFVTVGPEFILALFGKKYEKGGFNPFAQMKQVAGLGVALGTVGGGVKGLSQGGLKGATAGLYLGAKGSLMAGDKGQGFGGLSAGRDFVGKSLADGPDSSGGFMQRFAQKTAANALRSEANKAYDIAKDFQKNNLTPLKEKFEEHDAAYTSAVANRDNARARLQSVTNEILTQGYAATSEQQEYIQAITREITNYDLDATNSFMERTTAANAFNAARADFKKLYKNYTDEVNSVNDSAGKSQTKFQQEKTDPNFKVPDELK